MPQLSVHTLGKMLVIWGTLLPFIVLPYTSAVIDRALPLVDMPVTFLGSCIGSLVLIGLGLSFLVLPSDEPHKGMGIF
jgi:hypothetical protein